MATSITGNAESMVMGFFRKLSSSLMLEGSQILSGTPKGLQPGSLEKEILKALTQGVRHFVNNIYLPNRLTLRINPLDMGQIRPYLSTFQKEAEGSIKKHINECLEQAKNINSVPTLHIVEDPALKPGEFVCDAELLDSPSDKDTRQ